ncbi:MAG TPA: pantetheine-phosphate adenylyltransferase [Candidatus Coprenecus stercoravium]|uniref:Phosphopantetheine adenylyltransferase n=1 Tax=Candidatus Coprenecus stercoravium TaxID=2840735 RepID=A0A9D2GPT2_9BACT|nr:pantetheine-phosphate adenylyltransferase [Candidatus Coprenecus stercoravium]
MATDRRTAIFPGSFDPFTLGHMDVLQSALKLFDKIYVAVGYNHLKQGFLSPQTRVRLIEDAVRPLVEAGSDIEVLSYTGLTVDLCREKGTDFIVRGLRTTTDFELESVIAQANRKMCPDTVTVFIPASHVYSFISSTVVRDVIVNGGDAAPFLPANISISDYIKV